MPDSNRPLTYRGVTKTQLRAAEEVLASATADDALAACETALDHLRQATAAHDQHVREVSHDIRNTLTAVMGHAQILERLLAKGALSPERVGRALAQITLSVNDANEILRRMSD
jgi:signal transduction histidine kinase